MRRRSQLHCIALVAAALLGGGTPEQARAELDRADPLPVPADAALQPEEATDLSAAERLARGEASLRERGHEQLPFIALAYLDLARERRDLALALRALGVAPDIPGVRYEAARASGRPEELLGALRAVGDSFPALAWALTAGGGALGVALLCGTAVALILGFARGAALHGHVLGHVVVKRDPPAWPGVLAALAGLGALPLLGVGPLALTSAAGMLGALRLSRRDSVALASCLVLAGLAIGPGLDFWSRLAANHRDRYLLGAAWRVERGYPLPGDEELLERTLGLERSSPFARFALAAARARLGDLEAALAVLPDAPGEIPRRRVRSALLELRGNLKLARGELRAAIADLEGARWAHESAGVLFNLSQAYGRALRLADQTPLFDAARQLDAELVHAYTRRGQATFHTYLIPASLPALEYVVRALEPSVEAAAIALRLREQLLGRTLPEAAWGALPLMGLLVLVLRRPGVSHCSRCDRPVCRRCGPEDSEGSSTCARCVRLFTRESGDARVRRQQLEIDRQRQRRLAWQRMALGLVVPGLVALRGGELLRGGSQLLATALGAALAVAPSLIAVPWEVGALGTLSCRALGLALLIPAYLISASAAVRCLDQARTAA